MFLSMFLRIGVWRNIWRAYRRGFRGNLRGDGLVLGGVFVIGPGDQVGRNLHNKYFLTSVRGCCDIVFSTLRVFYWSTARRSLGIKWICWRYSEQPAKCKTTWPDKMNVNWWKFGEPLHNKVCSMLQFVFVYSLSLTQFSPLHTEPLTECVLLKLHS